MLLDILFLIYNIIVSKDFLNIILIAYSSHSLVLYCVPLRFIYVLMEFFEFD